MYDIYKNPDYPLENAIIRGAARRYQLKINQGVETTTDYELWDKLFARNYRPQTIPLQEGGLAFLMELAEAVVQEVAEVRSVDPTE